MNKDIRTKLTKIIDGSSPTASKVSRIIKLMNEYNSRNYYHLPENGTSSSSKTVRVINT